MSEKLELAKEFPPASYDAWRELVDKALKGADFDKKLTTRLHDGITLKPIYTKDDWPAAGDPSGFPGFLPFARGARPGHPVADGWDIRQAVTHPDVKIANKEILTDLERGVTSVLLRLDAAGRAGLDPDSPDAADLAGVGGVMVSTADDLDSALAGVMLDLCPVALDAGAGAPAAAALMAEVWRKRGCKGDAAMGALNIDPLGSLAALGKLPQGLDKALADMAGIAAKMNAEFPNVTTVAVNSSAFYNAGASNVEDLGCAMATAVAYLRALTGAGLSVDAACRQIAFSISVGTDFFAAIAKLRAARMLWGRITEACGATDPARRMTLHVDTADRVLSKRDPWVNMLRTTTACFAAGVAGADSVTAAPFTDALGLPTDFARRIARNTQIILQEESNLARVIDPAGGSWFIETLTTQMAERAWEEFQAIEAMGGMAAALQSGELAAKLAAAWEERRKSIATRKDELTGINQFPDLGEKPVEVKTADLAALRKGAVARLKTYHRTVEADTADALFEAAGKATLGALTAALGGTPTEVTPLPVHRLGEDFEALRDASDAHLEATGTRPRVFLANMGPIAKHTARASYARNFFEMGGIEALTNDGFATADDLAQAFRASGAAIACLCGSDDQYEADGAAFAKALKAAGATRVYLAGRGEIADVDETIFVGCDALEVLRAAHVTLGVAHLGVTRKGE